MCRIKNPNNVAQKIKEWQIFIKTKLIREKTYKYTNSTKITGTEKCVLNIARYHMPK